MHGKDCRSPEPIVWRPSFRSPNPPAGGFRFRSEVRAHEAVAETFGKRLIALELAQPRFYHLDTCFLPLDDKTALYYPGAFDGYGRKAIKQFVEDPVPVSSVDARQFSCNGIALGRSLVLNKVTRALKAQLDRRGYKVFETSTSEFMKAGGSVKCLVLRM